MIVVADSSPINYLVLIDQADILPRLFGTIVLPNAVFVELQSLDTPLKVRTWITNAPHWIDVRSVALADSLLFPTLDPGEREAIQLALQLGLDRVLMDEAEGRRQAESVHLTPRGTLGILEEASQAGYLNFNAALTELLKTNFRASADLIATFHSRNA